MNIGLILDVVLSLIAVFMAIVLHEVAHGYVAARLGDPTAKASGRLTLNPLAHVDPIGTILVPLALAVLSAPLFGWAKPVPVNPNYFKNPFRGMLFVAIAGPGTNLALALGTVAVGRILLMAVPNSMVTAAGGLLADVTHAAFYLLGAFVIYNVVLAIFNLIPIPPLDGSRVLTYFLPMSGKRFMLSMERYGFFVLMAVILLGGVSFLFRGIEPILQSLLGWKWVLLLRALG